MDEQVLITVREDGSRVVQSSLDKIADSSARAGTAQDALSRVLARVSTVMERVAASVDRLNVSMSATATAAQRSAASEQAAAAASDALTRASTASATALQGKAVAAAEAATANAALAETEEQARARIHAMITESMAAATASRARMAAEKEAAVAGQASAAGTGAQSAAMRELIAAQNASMINFNKFTTLARGADAAMAALKSKSLTTAAFEKAINDLGKAVDAGVISEAKYAAALEISDRVKIKDIAITEAQNAVHKKGMLNARAQAEIGTSISEILSGNFGRLRRTGASLANQTGLLTKLMSPMGLAILAAAATVGVLIAAFIKGQEEEDKFNRALISTGANATTTASQLVDMANRVGATSGKYGDAEEALASLANSGKYASYQFEALTQTAVDFATMTGGKVADGVKFVDQIMSGNLDTLMKVDKQYHFLSTTQLDEIMRLQEQGQQEQATAVAQRAASEAVHRRAEEVQANAGIMVRAWEGVKEAASGAWNAMKGIGQTESFAAQAKALNDQIAALKAAQAGASHSVSPFEAQHPERAAAQRSGQIASLESQLKIVQKQLVEQGYAQTMGGSYTNESGKSVSVAGSIATNAAEKSKAAAVYLSQFKTPLEELNAAEQKAAKSLDDFLLGKHSPEAIASAQKQFHQAIDQAVKSYQSSVPKTPKTHAAADDAAKYQRALASLLDTVNPAAAATRKYTEAQTLLAEAVKKGDLTQAQANADLKLYKARLQDAMDPLIAMNKRTDEKLKGLQDVTGATTASNEAQRDANTLLQQGVVVGEQWITMQTAKYRAIEKATEQQRLMNQVQRETQRSTPDIGNTLGALGNLESSGKVSHDQSQQFLMKKFPDIFEGTQDAMTSQVAKYKAYYKTIDALEKAHYLSSQGAEQARLGVKLKIQQTEMGSTMTFLGGLSALMNTHSKKAFAIGKAAAIAQAAINTYSSAVAAFQAMAGIPYVGPILGAVAAAAAIAAGLANISAIRSQQMPAYYTGGYTGMYDVRRIAGVVHGQEYVMDAQTTSRLGVPMLDALRAGVPVERLGRGEQKGTKKPVEKTHLLTQNITVVQQGKPDRYTPMQNARAMRRASMKEYARV